jgi:RNA-directed DNA polymerase
LSSLEKLKAAKSLDDVAALLGYKPSRLAFILYQIPVAAKYKTFEIPKRSGGVRKISAPTEKLKLLQRRLANLLYLCLADIEKNNFPHRPLAHGFSKSLSIVTNASAHKRKRFVFNLDIKDFFPSINFGRVRGILIKDKRFELDPKVATVISQIACHDNALPQGSPCSPVISNIIGHILDIRLVRLARDYKCTYSRYADDITFSTNRKEFPPELAMPTEGGGGQWQVGTILASEIMKVGFKINDKKTRMQVRGSRQVTTGLLVNEKVNIRPEYYRTVRSMCHALFNTGTYFQMIPATLSAGNVGDQDIKEVATTPAPLQGKLEHIYYVRNSVDRRESVEKKKTPTATRRLYQKFLFHKHFVLLDKPLIIPEGKTDSIYLRAAIEMLVSFHPKLGGTESGKFKSAIRFMNYTSTVRDVLQLGGGTGDFKFFILHYKKALSEFKCRPLLYPVILLIDNDDGAKDVFSVAKEIGAADISLKTTEPFYRLYENLYLVKTPEGNQSNKMSCIEDCFALNVRATELEDKKFDPNKKHGAEGKYGKTIFAEKVIRPNKSNIDFSGFAPLLKRIVDVLDDYSSTSTKTI